MQAFFAEARRSTSGGVTIGKTAEGAMIAKYGNNLQNHSIFNFVL